MKTKGWPKSLLALLRPYRKEDHLNYNMPLLSTLLAPDELLSLGVARVLQETI